MGFMCEFVLVGDVGVVSVVCWLVGMCVDLGCRGRLQGLLQWCVWNMLLMCTCMVYKQIVCSGRITLASEDDTHWTWIYKVPHLLERRSSQLRSERKLRPAAADVANGSDLSRPCRAEAVEPKHQL